MKTFSKAAAAALFTATMGVAFTASAADCNRQCLKDLADDYIAALVAHQPGDVPLSDDLKTVENAKRIDAGEGLWQTASKGPTTYRIYVPDEVSQQVGGMFMIEEEGQPALLGLRLKLDGNGDIVEAEHMLARNLNEGQLANLQAPRKPLTEEVMEEYRDSRGRLIHIAKSYYDSLDENNGSLAPYADTCVRHENGFQTARNAVSRESSFGILSAMGCERQMDTMMWTYIDTIDNRRVDIADPLTGLAMGFSHFHHDMEETEYRLVGVPGMEVREMEFDPFDLPAIHIYKIWGGKIHEIEAMGFTADYNSPTGWED